MGRKDWYYVHLPNLLIKRLDEFLDTPRAKGMGYNNKPELLRNMINEFLDKQESNYNNIETIPNFIREMRSGDHFVMTYEDKPQFEEIISSFVDEGLRKNNIIVFYISQNEEQLFLDSLKKTLDVDRLINSGEITIIPAEECYVEGKFTIQPLFRSLEELKKLVTKKSKSGISMIGTPAGSFVKEGSTDTAYFLETKVHEAIGRFGIPLTIMCPYKSLPENLEKRFSECHHLIVKRAIVERKSGLL